MTDDLLSWRPPEPRGKTFNSDRDGARLSAQAVRVLNATLNSGWRTLSEISAITRDPEASVSARLRDLRRAGFLVEREYVERGLHRYSVKKERQ